MEVLVQSPTTPFIFKYMYLCQVTKAFLSQFNRVFSYMMTTLYVLSSWRQQILVFLCSIAGGITLSDDVVLTSLCYLSEEA